MEAKWEAKMAGQAAVGSDSHQSLDFDRIAYLLNPEDLVGKVVTVVGLGSGGAPACQHLSMSGVTKWNLYDPDKLDDTNLIKHPGMRKDLGRRGRPSHAR